MNRRRFIVGLAGLVVPIAAPAIVPAGGLMRIRVAPPSSPPLVNIPAPGVAPGDGGFLVPPEIRDEIMRALYGDTALVERVDAMAHGRQMADAGDAPSLRPAGILDRVRRMIARTVDPLQGLPLGSATRVGEIRIPSLGAGGPDAGHSLAQRMAIMAEPFTAPRLNRRRPAG